MEKIGKTYLPGKNFNSNKASRSLREIANLKELAVTLRTICQKGLIS
jgi:hypothetical protein